MQRAITRRFAALSVATLLLGGCAGGAEVALATLGFIAPIGGTFSEDGDLTTPALDDTGFGITLNVDISVQQNPLYLTDFAVSGFNSLQDASDGCGNILGQITGTQVIAYEDKNGVRGAECFRGQFANANVLVLADGRRLLRNFSPDLTSGVWQDIRNSNRRFRFDEQVVPANAGAQGSFAGCELAGSVITPVQGAYTASDVGNGVYPPRIDTFIIQRAAGGEIWSGEIVGLSGIRLTQGNRELLLERRNETASCGS